MPGPYVGDAASFLIQTVFGILILLVMLRFLLQWTRADFYNQISQSIVKVTQPVLRPLRRVVPGFKGLDLAAVVLMLALQFVELWLIFRVGGYAPKVTGLAVLTVAELTKLFINVFVFAIIIQIIISWVNPGAYNPVSSLLHSLTEPLLRPARRLMPPISGLDLSPIPVLVGLQLAQFLLVAPVRDLGRGLM